MRRRTRRRKKKGGRKEGGGGKEGREGKGEPGYKVSGLLIIEAVAEVIN